MEAHLLTAEIFSHLFENSLSSDSTTASQATSKLYQLENDQNLYSKPLLNAATSNQFSLPARLAALKILFKKVRTRLDNAAGRTPLNEQTKVDFSLLSQGLETLRASNDNRILKEGTLRLLALFEVCKLQHGSPSFLDLFLNTDSLSDCNGFLQFFCVFAEVFSSGSLHRSIRRTVKRELKEKEIPIFKFLEFLVNGFLQTPDSVTLDRVIRLLEALSLFRVDVLSHPTSMVFLWSLCLFSLFKGQSKPIESLFLQSSLHYGQLSHSVQNLFLNLLPAAVKARPSLDLSLTFKRTLRLLDPVLEFSNLSTFLLSEPPLEMLEQLLSANFTFEDMIGRSLVGLSLCLELARVLAGAGDVFRSALLLRNIAENFPFFLSFRNRHFVLIMDSVHLMFETGGYEDLDEMANVLDALKEAWLGDSSSFAKLGNVSSFSESSKTILRQLAQVRGLGVEGSQHLENSGLGLLFDLESLYQQILPVELPPRLGTVSAEKWFADRVQGSLNRGKFNLI